MVSRRIFWAALFAIFLNSTNCFASEAEDIRKEIAELKARVVTLEGKLSQMERNSEKQQVIIERQSEKLATVSKGIVPIEGLQIGAGATFVIQGTNEANNTGEPGDDVTDASYSIDLEIEKEVGDEGLAFIHLEAGGGAGVEGELDVFSNVNRDADNDENVRLTEVWYEHKLFDERLILSGGKLDATVSLDQNAIAHDEASQFLGRIFRNSPVIDFPDNGPGIKAGVFPADWLEFSTGYFDGDNDWEDIGDNPFTFVQINLKPGFFDREGNYRFYGWYNDTYHTELLNTTKDKEPGYGLGLSFDQQLQDILTAFARFGLEDEKVYNLEYSWSAGLQTLGKTWGRDQDILALAIGQVMPGDDYKNAVAGRNANTEGHFEAYYSFYVNDHLTLSPDLQVI